MLNPEGNTTKIPKIIHYVWVGGAPLTPLAYQCIASWKKHLPDYELKLWNESNSPMSHHYVQAMYEQKKWAFVSDYIRFWALENEGGVYLDTDLEVFRTLNPLLNNSGFVARSKSGQIESSIIAAAPHSPFITKALAWYDADTKYSISETSPLVLARALEGSVQNEITVLDHSYFHAIDEGEFLSADSRSRAYGIHHWAESWVPHARLRKIARRLGFMSVIKKFRRKHYV